MSDFDLLVIGAGPGGYPAAIRGAQLGLRTACIERELLGGVCLNWGCIPSKALIKTAEVAHHIRDAKAWGLGAGELDVDMPAVIARSRKLSKRFNKGVASLFKKYGVTRLEGEAVVSGPGEVTITGKDAKTVTATHIVLATGASARTFPDIEPDGERILTYREAIVRDVLPKTAVVLGAGAIGTEFAYVWHALGADVTVIEAQEQVLPLEDPEAAEVVRSQFDSQGIALRTGTRVAGVSREGDGCLVTLEGGETVAADVVLIALGITPNSEGLGLHEVGVRTDKRGFIEVDTSYRTSVEGIYAVGDVANRGPALAHAAMRQAHICVERIAGHTVSDLSDADVPSVTYCQPQLAQVGLTEAQAREAGHEVKVGRFPFMANGRAQGSMAPAGFVKAVIDATFGEILGVTIVGGDASELVAEVGVAMRAEATAETIATTVHAHPSASEAVLEAFAAALGVSVHI